MSHITLVLAPYDSGVRSARHGLGPQRLMEDGLKERLEEDAHAVEVQSLILDEAYPTEIRTTFQLLQRISRVTESVVKTGSFPIVLAGNCNAAVGAAAGVGMEHLAVHWLDGNADFNTPETTCSGFLDGMGLAMMNGRCWSNMLKQVRKFVPIPDERLVLLGARDFDQAERLALEQSGVVQVHAEDFFRATGRDSISRMADLAERSFIHLDVDVHDPAEAPANQYQPRGGPSVLEVRKVCCAIARTLPLTGVSVASYDPAYDPEGKTSHATIETLAAILAHRDDRLDRA